MFRSIKNKLIFLFLIAVLTPLLVMRLIAYPSAQKVIQETTVSNLQSIGSKKVSQVNDWLQKLKTTAERIASNPLVADAVHVTNAEADTGSKFLSHIPYDALFHRFMISDVSGNIRISSDDKLIGLNISDIQGFNRTLDGKTYISDIVSSVFYDAEEFGNSSEQLPAMYVFAPVKNEDDHVAGVTVFQADLSVLNNEMQEIHGDSYDAYIINQHGLMITESKFADQLKKAGLIAKRTAMELSIVEPQTKKFTKSAELCLKGINGFDVKGYSNYRGQKVLGVWYWIPEIKWGVITEMSTDEVSLAMNNLKDPLIKIFSYLTITGVILAVAGIAFAILIGQKIARPLMELTTATRKMSAGDLSQRVTMKTQDEVRELGDAFNVMAESVQEKTSKLEETTNFLNSILVSSTEYAIIASDLGGNILAFNEGAKRIYGYEPNELILKLNIQILHAKTDVKSGKVRKILETTLQTGIYKNEMQLVRKNGETFTGYSTFTTRYATDGKPIGFVTITRDITDRKKIEDQIRRSERLASIGELAASIAHEIRNPLGAISNSVCILKRDLALDGDDQKLFEMVVEETDRLNSIITDFLTFAHPAEYHFVSSDIIAIIDETLLLLEQDEGFNEKIKIIKVFEDNVPKIYLDRNWIRKVFWNLLVNSIDAMPRGGKIYIHVRRPNALNNEEIEIVFTDTGKGIPPEIVKKIFEPFFTTKKPKGTGLGLSIVHRIVDNHGGIIDVKSERNNGAAFTIRLPIKNKQVKNVLV